MLVKPAGQERLNRMGPRPSVREQKRRDRVNGSGRASDKDWKRSKLRRRPRAHAIWSLPFVDTSFQRSADADGPNFQKTTDCAMTMAAVIDSRPAQAPPRPRAAGIARVDILTDLVAAEPIWRALEAQGRFCSPYQRYDVLSAWQNQAGRH